MCIRDRVNAVLTSLDLAGNPQHFGIGIGDEGAKAIAEALKVKAVVTTLNLGCNQIRDEGAIAIAEALKVSAVLTKLDIRANDNMGDGGKQAVRDAVKDRSGFVLEL